MRALFDEGREVRDLLLLQDILVDAAGIAFIGALFLFGEELCLRFSEAFFELEETNGRREEIFNDHSVISIQV